MQHSRNQQGWDRTSSALAFKCFMLVLLSGCAASSPSTPTTITAEEAFAVQSRVVDCEWRAVNRFDDGSYTVSQLAQRVLGICAVELIQARRAFHLSLHDPEIDL